MLGGKAQAIPVSATFSHSANLAQRASETTPYRTGLNKRL